MLIRINRSTFRRNPTAGSTQTTFATGLAHTRATYRENDGSGVYDLEADGDRLLVVACKTAGPPRFACGQTYNPDDFATGGYLKIETSREIQTIQHFPLPDWIYEYESGDVTCTECGAAFPHQELQSDCHFTGEDEVCSFTVCPKCGEWDCCDVEYEDPAEVAAELGLI